MVRSRARPPPDRRAVRGAGSCSSTIQHCIVLRDRHRTLDREFEKERELMVVEYIRYVVGTDRVDEFEAAYRRASAVLDDDPHCLGYEVARGVEEPERFVVRIHWDSVEGHEQGFRTSARFADFFAAVKPFFADIEEMKHYAVRFAQTPARP